MADEICPPLTELSEPLSAQVRLHLRGCLRCKALVRHLGVDYDRDATVDELPGPLEYRSPPKVSSGDVCAAVVPGLHHRLLCVVTAEDAGVLEAVPISDETQYACDRDLLFEGELLGYETMAEAWNIGSLLIEDIAEVLARLDDKTYEHLADLIEAVEGGREAVALPTGAPLRYDVDARHDFQQRESQRARPFFASSSLLRSASRLPDLIARATEESGRSVAHLSRRFGPMVGDRVRWVDELIADRLDVRDVPGRTIGALLAEFEFRPSERLAAIVRRTGWAEDWASSPIALIGSEPEGESSADADEYISEVFDGLIDALASRTGPDA